MEKARSTIFVSVILMVLGTGGVGGAGPMGTAFTYQGQLKQDGVPVNDTADLKFTLYDASTTPPGIQVGPTLVFDGQPGHSGPIEITNGLFSVALDFGAGIFAGEGRWLEIAVRSPHDPSDTLPYTTLTPRQELTPTPYALHAATAGGGWGSGTAGRLAKFDDDDALADSVLFEKNSRIGMGTTNPMAYLHIHGDDTAPRITNSNTGTV